MRIDIGGLGAEFEGVGRGEDGIAVFVPGALVGETVDVEIMERKKSYARARLQSIEHTSPERIEPFCSYYRQCGGCDTQHINYDASLKYKTQHVRDCLSRIAGLDEPQVRPALRMDSPYAYRNKAELPVAAGKVGFYARGSRNVVDLPDGCPLLRPELNRALGVFREWLRRCRVRSHDPRTKDTGVRHLILRVNHAGEVMVVVVTSAAELPHSSELWRMLQQCGVVSLYVNLNDRPGAAVTGARYVHLAGAKTYIDTILGAQFELSPHSFFQVNPLMTDVLYSQAIAAAQLAPGDTLLDAYCGAGTVGIALLKAAQLERECALTGIELVPEAVDNAHRNALLNSIDRAEFHCGKCEVRLDAMLLTGYRPDIAIIDPPRKGCDAALLWALARAKPKRLVYISCNPSTLARDVKLLTAESYVLEYAQPVDMFPWSAHCEVCVKLCRE